VITIPLDCTAEELWKRPGLQEVVKGLEMTQMMECGLLVMTVSRGT
jgi:hypothetical protein